ncbi:hypothetical protein [Bradyrhizobium neotropicale]|uniref:hypothetical protein n=1 Tax=Bradyrhizobium neotropicale TaxID=1497615 RepID=UPI001AD6A631|nr:hypothetical protein [Bradyrhizobium neotropicale]MBO4228031.1 hypothetical protein [Bradyrhizobium neotropicale]
MILQAIVTKYLGPTDRRGSRVKAYAAAGYIIHNWDSSLGSDANHTAAAKALATRSGWAGAWYGGGMPDGRGNVYVCTESRHGQAEPAFIIERQA